MSELPLPTPAWKVDLLQKLGWDETMIHTATNEEIDRAIKPLLEADALPPSVEKKMPFSIFETPEELALYVASKVHEMLPYTEMTISANAANKLNLGNYSSADRGVFMSKKIYLPANIPEKEAFDFIRTKTEKLQHLCEAQLAGIVVEYMNQEGYDDATWTKLHKKIFTKAIRAAKAAFGIVDPAPAAK